MTKVAALMADVVGAEHVLSGSALGEDYLHDEALTAAPATPEAVVLPASTGEVAAVVAVAGAYGIPLTARGSATGLSGGCTPLPGGVVVSFERMNRILEVDTGNHVAVVQPGVTLRQLDDELAGWGLVYPVSPGENSASLGGNVATNAGGMRAVKYGVTRHQVLGLEAVIGTGEVMRTGGRFVKATSGYDLTQLIIGSEGTLALVTEATLRVYPRPEYRSTLLAPFQSLEAVTAAVPAIVAGGTVPLMIEYIDVLTMAAMTESGGLDLGIPQPVKDAALAYLVVVLEGRRDDRLGEDVEALATLVSGLGALDVYVLPPQAGAQLIEARERAFWTAKAAGADDIIDMVVPRASIPAYMARVSRLAEESGSWVAGCGHAGDGNVHLSVFQGDGPTRDRLVRDIFATGMSLGGAISGEHGIGTEKKKYLAELENPAKIALWRRIKQAFDPQGILNPGKIFDAEEGEQ